MTLQVELVSPERVLLSVEATMVLARTIGGGDIAFLTGHASFIGALDTWTLEIFLEGGGTQLAAVHGGFISVNDDHVKILSDLAELAGDIDSDRARAAADRAQVLVERDDDGDAEAQLARATARLRATGALV